MAREWLTQHYLGRGWDEEDATALAALLARVQHERDEYWAKCLDPQNVGTDYGRELCKPEMAALLLEEKLKLTVDEARRERDERWTALIEDVRYHETMVCSSVNTWRYCCDEILRRAKQDEGSACADRAETVEETHRRWAK